MRIAEIFYSIQGEGSLVGVPSVFVRTSGCNLRCKWCDTPYTSWEPEWREMSIEDIVRAVTVHGSKHVVLTGGEPMIAPDATALSEHFAKRELHVTVETAGTVYRVMNCDLMSISPKLANSIPNDREGGRFAMIHERLRYQPEVLKRLMKDYDYQLKFVIADARDLREVQRIQEELGCPANKMQLMPEGVTREVVATRGLWLAELCKQNGYRYSPRLHIDLWGDKRGV